MKARSVLISVMGATLLSITAALATGCANPSTAATAKPAVVAATESPAKPEAAAAADSNATPDPLLAEVDHRVTLSGEFTGWGGTCRGAPPVSRSDWTLQTGGRCLFVNGPVPPGYSAIDPKKTAGKVLTVTGMLRRDAAGRLYLELLKQAR